MWAQYLYDSHIYKGDFMKFRPLHDRVLIEVLDGSEKTAGGIITVSYTHLTLPTSQYV